MSFNAFYWIHSFSSLKMYVVLRSVPSSAHAVHAPCFLSMFMWVSLCVHSGLWGLPTAIVKIRTLSHEFPLCMFPVNNYPRFTANEKTWLVTGVPFCQGRFSFVKVQEIAIISQRWAISVSARFKDTKNRVLTYSPHQEEPSIEPLPCPTASVRKLTVFPAGLESPFLIPSQPHDVAHAHPPNLHAHPRKQSVSRDWLLSPLSLSYSRSRVGAVAEEGAELR